MDTYVAFDERHHPVLRGRTFRVDGCGAYDELIEVPLSLLEPAESGQSSIKVEAYVKRHQGGSRFPPIDVCGTTTEFPTYKIINGHHRWLAAQRVHLPSLTVWTCNYVEYHRDCCHKPFPSLARLGETVTGHWLAHALHMRWCVLCGSSLNMRDPNTEYCLSCALSFPHFGYPLATDFSRYVRSLHCDCPHCQVRSAGVLAFAPRALGLPIPLSPRVTQEVYATSN
jgi:hypothetical protein